MEQRFFLTGFMGSGKTTVGQALGKAIGYAVVDTDEWIEEMEQMTIKELFTKYGESYFRKQETKALMELSQKQCIITTGGGIINKLENRHLMKEKGIVVYLHCELSEILKRLEGDETRPLLKNKDTQAIQALFNQRIAWYQEADIIVDTTGKTVLQIVQELKEILLKKIKEG